MAGTVAGAAVGNVASSTACLCEIVAGTVGGAAVGNVSDIAVVTCETLAGTAAGAAFGNVSDSAVRACEIGAGRVAGTGSSGYFWLVAAIEANLIASIEANAVAVGAVVLLDASRRALTGWFVFVVVTSYGAGTAICAIVAGGKTRLTSADLIALHAVDISGRAWGERRR